MTGTNDYVPFAVGTGANVETQSAYVADSQTATGVQSGTARSNIANKAWRQATMMASAIGGFISGQNFNANDDGVPANLTTAFQSALQAYIAANVTTAPAGRVDTFAMNTAPTGYLAANGGAISRTTYANLFAAIGTTYGTGDGSTTFNLPDMRGYFVRGFDSSGAIDPSRTFGSTQADAFASHTHTVNSNAPINAGTTTSFAISYAPSGGSSGATGGTETRPKNVAMLICIKY